MQYICARLRLAPGVLRPGDFYINLKFPLIIIAIYIHYIQSNIRRGKLYMYWSLILSRIVCSPLAFTLDDVDKVFGDNGAARLRGVELIKPEEWLQILSFDAAAEVQGTMVGKPSHIDRRAKVSSRVVVSVSQLW